MPGSQSASQFQDDPELEIEWTIPDLPETDDVLPDIFYDPIRNKARRLNIQGDMRIIRELDDIQVPDIGNAISDLEQCRFQKPLTAAQAAVYCQDLLITDHVFKRVMKEFYKAPDTQMSKRAVVALRVNRARLMNSLDTPNLILESKHKFTHNWVDKAAMLEPKVFLGILQTSQALNLDAGVRSRLKDLGPGCKEFEALDAQHAFNPNINRGPIMGYSLNELFTLVRFLERRWFFLNFVPDKFGFLVEVIIARLAEILTVSQPSDVFMNLTAHRRLISENEAVVNEVCLQDFFWTLVPMHRSLSLRTQFGHYTAEIPFVISDEFVGQVRNDLKRRIREQKNVELQERFYTRYSKMYMRYSEFKRYVRDHPGGDHISSTILTEMRGQEAANRLQEKLAPLPWEMIDGGEFEESELDVLWLLMFDNRFNNVAKSKFDWMATAVRFRGDMVDEDNYVEALKDYEYPMIVQSFNRFGLFFEGDYFDHQDATRAVIHWMLILLVRFKGKCMGSVLTSLHHIVPTELKTRMGLRYKS